MRLLFSCRTNFDRKRASNRDLFRHFALEKTQIMKLGRCLLVTTCAISALLFAFSALPVSLHASLLQMGGMSDKSPKTLPSPPAKATVTLNSTNITINYNTPSMRGRKIFGGLLPYGQWWRTGANPATSFKTTGALKIGGTMVPAGSYTLYSIPSETTWQLIINKQTGQWGTEYDKSKDLARIDMQKKTLSSPQEKMSISFENTSGSSTELHVRWETTDVYVPVVAQ